MERRYTRLASYISKLPGYNVTLVTLSDAVSVLKELQIELQQINIKLADKSNILSWIQKSKFIGKFHGYALRIRLMIYLYLKRPTRIVFCHNPNTMYDIFLLQKNFFRKWLFKVIAPVIVAAVDSHLKIYRDHEMEFLHELLSVDALSPRIANFIQSKNSEANVRIAPCSFTDYSRIKTSENRNIDLLMVSRFTEKKGYELIEDIADIANNYKMVICGFGHLLPKIPNAEFKSLSAPLPLYRKAKIFLSIQEVNNYPSQSLLEAMASGCAIIATDVGETRMILDESNSILIRYDALELKDAIERLMNQPELIQQLGEHAIKKAINEHTIERYSDYFCNDVLALHD